MSPPALDAEYGLDGRNGASVPVPGGQRKRRLVTAAVVVASIGLFALQWSQAPRVTTSPRVEAALAGVRGELYLGETFEGLPLRTVHPFLYSDCVPGRKK